jgi:hypothetical protein
LGLAVRSGRRYRLDGEMEIKLRTLQARRDIIRTMNQRRLEGAKDVRVLGKGRVSGRVVRTGSHDEAGASPWVVVRDAEGVEHYARLGAGAAVPQAGKAVMLQGSENGLARLTLGRGRDLSL